MGGKLYLSQDPHHHHRVLRLPRTTLAESRTLANDEALLPNTLDESLCRRSWSRGLGLVSRVDPATAGNRQQGYLALADKTRTAGKWASAICSFVLIRSERLRTYQFSVPGFQVYPTAVSRGRFEITEENEREEQTWISRVGNGGDCDEAE